MTTILIIKGTPKEARAAATERKIAILTSQYTKGLTHASCSDEDGSKAVRWFSEGPHDTPFPVGTLLWYTTKVASPSTVLLVKWYRLPAQVRRDLLEAYDDRPEAEAIALVEQMGPKDVFKAWLEYNGIIGYSESLWDMPEAIKAAAL